MARPPKSARPSAPAGRLTPLQERVKEWLARLERALAHLPPTPGPGPGSDYTPLSPVKREKHAPHPPSGPTYPAGRVLLRLLAERLLLPVFPAIEPELLELAGGPALAAAEEAASRSIRAEIAGLPDNFFDSYELAGLPFDRPDRKRSGAYYTAPALARRITAAALTPEQAQQPLLDPACGGGVFLLAALDRLAGLSPASLPHELVTGRLYGLDLNPLAVRQSRLAVLKRLVEIKPAELNSALVVALAAQIRCGNALVGPVSLLGEEENEEEGEGLKSRRLLLEKAQSGESRAALAEYRRLETGLEAKRANLAESLAALPIFNDPGDGAALAALRPFGWAGEFPEVFARGGFGTVVGNPPYVGFNDYSGVEKAYFAKIFPEVYNLKSDLLYYFIRRGVELLAPGGRLGFVTSRFWKEAAFAAPLRGWLLAETSLLELEDLGGEQHFSDAEVDVCLLFAARQPAPAGHALLFRYDGVAEQIPQQSLSGQTPWTWLRQLPAERLLLAEIAERSVPLGELALCRTGVQTGLDRVFFVEGGAARALDPALLKQAIKNADITPGRVTWRGQWLIYPPPGLDPAQFPATLAFLEKHRPELARRRRYSKAFPFYELQWPREPGVFEPAAKLVTPYKAPRNTFGVDRCRFYFSTDVVSVVFPAEWGIEDLAANFLNSRLSTFQFRSYGKPVGGGQWDYYANPVKKLAFPQAALPARASAAAAATASASKAGPVSTSVVLGELARPSLVQAAIDELVFALYDLTPPQRDLLHRFKI